VEGRSFSQGVKDELARDLPERNCCRRSLLAGLMLSEAEIVGLAPLNQFVLETASAPCVRLVLRLVRHFEGPTAVWEATRRQRPRPETRYTVTLGPSAPRVTRRFIERTGLEISGGLRFSAARYPPPKRRCCRRSFAQGAFLASGSVQDPHRAYHLEWTVRDPEFATLLLQVLRELDLPVRHLHRKYHDAIYVKAAGDVARALTLMGATQGLLALEEVRSVKEMKNQIHRRVNCETSNLARQGDVAASQMALLTELDQRQGLRGLPPDMRALARVRMRRPEASYRELGKALVPPLTKVTVGRRLQRLLRLAQILLAEEGSI